MNKICTIEALKVLLIVNGAHERCALPLLKEGFDRRPRRVARHDRLREAVALSKRCFEVPVQKE